MGDASPGAGKRLPQLGLPGNRFRTGATVVYAQGQAHASIETIHRLRARGHCLARRCHTAAALAWVAAGVTGSLVVAAVPADAGAGAPRRGSSSLLVPLHAGTGGSGGVQRRAACPPPAHAGEAACLAIEERDRLHRRPGRARLADSGPVGYGPSSLRRAYNLPAGGGDGRTVAVVDAHDDPAAAADLAAYRSAFGLPPCTASDGCFTKVNDHGGRGYPKPNSGWAGEISLDLDMVSAVCPRCHILLVEAASPYLRDLGRAVNQAVRMGARFVANGYGAQQSPADAGYDSRYFDHPGVAITVATGDAGYGVSYPAASPYVTAVGGTSLAPAGNGRGWAETAWRGTGSGCGDQAKPAWQNHTGCAGRALNDVAAVANPGHRRRGVRQLHPLGRCVEGVRRHVGDCGHHRRYLRAGGNPTPGQLPLLLPLRPPAALNDVTSGHNGRCGPSYLCAARRGYDGPTGLGTPDGVAAFTAPRRA